MLRLAPLIWTTDVLTKFVPVAVMVTGPLPARALDGEIVLSVGVPGTEPLTVNWAGLDCQPSSAALVTVNACVPGCAKSLVLS